MQLNNIYNLNKKKNPESFSAKREQLQLILKICINYYQN